MFLEILFYSEYFRKYAHNDIICLFRCKDRKSFCSFFSFTVFKAKIKCMFLEILFYQSEADEVGQQAAYLFAVHTCKFTALSQRQSPLLF